MSDVQDWKPGDKCRVCGCEVTIAAIAGEDVWCRDANGQHYTHALSDLRPIAPAEPEPPKRNTPEYLNTAYDRLDRAVQDVLKWSPDALRELVGAAMSMRDRAHNALDTHATSPAPALEPLEEEAVRKALQEIVVVDSLGQRVDGDSYRLVSSSASQIARALCSRFGVPASPPAPSPEPQPDTAPITPYVPTEAVRTCCYWNDHDGCLCKEPEWDCPVEKEVQP